MIRNRTPNVVILGRDALNDALVVERRADDRLPARYRTDRRWLLPIRDGVILDGATVRLTLDGDDLPVDCRANGNILWRAEGHFLALAHYGRLPQRRPVLFGARVATLDEAIAIAHRGDPLRPRALPDWADVIRLGATERDHEAMWSWYPMFGDEPKMLKPRAAFDPAR